MVSETSLIEQLASAQRQIGKAERRAKKALYEYLTGTDYGDADETSSRPIDTPYVDMTRRVEAANQGAPIEIKPVEPAPAQPAQAATATTAEPAQAARTTEPAAPSQPTPAPAQPTTQDPGF